MREAVEILVGIIVNIVHQLVAVTRRTLDRAEKAAGDAGLDERLALNRPQLEERPAGLAHHVLDLEYAAPDALRVGSQNPATVCSDLNPVGFEHRSLRLRGFDDERPIGRELAGRAEVRQVRIGGLEHTFGVCKFRFDADAPAQVGLA